MSLAPNFSTLPKSLEDKVKARWQSFLESAGARELDLAEPILRSLPQVWAASPFLVGICRRYSDASLSLVQDEVFQRPANSGEIAIRVKQATQGAEDDKEIMSALRRVRDLELLRIGWRDLAGWADLEETLQELSDLADACIAAALLHIEAELEECHGRPKDKEGREHGLIVMALGKLGGKELNFSSDVDLILAYAEAGETEGEEPLSHEAWFRRAAQSLVRYLEEVTEDGFVYRTDLRLRPFGDSGPPVMQVSAMESYYESQGREWERYAWIKARPVAGDLDGGRRLLDLLQPFIYRRYLDYGALESMREMKALISRQVAKRGLEEDIKLGKGGIREIEFIVQVFQLIRGGREAQFRRRQLLPVLELLAEDGQLPSQAAAELRSAYVFLRRLENRIQAWADQQTHSLPQGDEQRSALAMAMGYADWADLRTELDKHRSLVHQHFQAVFKEPEGVDQQAELDSTVLELWQELDDEARSLQILRSLGLSEDAQKLRGRLQSLKRNAMYSRVGERSRERFRQLLVQLFRLTGEQAPAQRLTRVLTIMEQIIGRGTYVALLLERPEALERLVDLCAASPWITHHIAQHPVVLDELLDSRSLYRAPQREELEQELDTLLGGVAEDDLEQQMNGLRNFRQSTMLRVAAADVSGAMPLMIVSDHLTELAEVVLVRALELAKAQMRAKFGLPVLKAGEGVAEMAVIAYGKLGGYELGYGSDLDLVFVHNGQADAESDGRRSMGHSQYFMRTAQHLIHLLSTRTAAGIAYEVDARLRPSGKSGPLVTSVEGYAQYQRERAWTWEQQALVRARGVAGGSALQQDFNRVRRDVLSRHRQPETLRDEVISMRKKMRSNLMVSEPGRFDLKQGEGGLTDIEFLVQYAVLRWSSDFPELTDWPDNIRILGDMAWCDLIGGSNAAELSQIYGLYRSKLHALDLQEEPALVDEQTFADEREYVQRLWVEVLAA